MVGVRLIPEQPLFRTDSERLVWNAIREQMREGDVLISSLRFTDQQAGDVEADLVLLMPDRGIAVIEVKGGQVSYANGEWTTTNGGGKRRIHPVAQARRAKHAVRNFLSRQEGWPHGLPHAEWFIAMPFTDVDGDLGPEGRRAQLIDRVDLAQASHLVSAVLAASPEAERLPAGPWVDEAVDLLLHAPGATTAVEGEGRATDSRTGTALALVGVGLVSAIVCALLAWLLGWIGVVVGVGAAALLTAGAVLLARTKRVSHPVVLIGLAVITAAAGGVIATVAVQNNQAPAPQLVVTDCNDNYDPCVPTDPTVTCSEVGVRVRVVGTDEYGLDRDGDGVGCESMPDPGSQTPTAQ